LAVTAPDRRTSLSVNHAKKADGQADHEVEVEGMELAMLEGVIRPGNSGDPCV
jgi:hypothetical protein